MSLVPVPAPAPDPLAEAHSAIAVLGKLSALFARRRQELAQSAGLSEQQWEVLERVSTEHFMPSLFAKQRESTAAAVSKILRQLTEKGLISASVGKRDARQRQYVLTAKGRRVIARIRRGREDAIQRVWLRLPPDELRMFADVGGRIAAALEAYVRCSGETKDRP